jgi:hypothetical protein
VPDLDLEFQNAAQKAQESAAAIDMQLKNLQENDRSHISLLISYSFVGFMAIVCIATGAGTWFLGWEKVAEPIKFLGTILGSVMLPVVTLVIGHYFGKENGRL